MPHLRKIVFLLALGIFSFGSVLSAPIPVLIVNGRNNHDWRTTSDAVRAILESTGRFRVDEATAPELKLPTRPREPKDGTGDFSAAAARYAALTKAAQPALDSAWAAWRPQFSRYAAVVLDYNGPAWPEPMQTDFVNYVKNGGSVLLIHAANNAFADWEAFNDMIGLGWRKGGYGVCTIIDETSGTPTTCCPDASSGHGSRHPFAITNRAPDHPVLKGMPMVWMHGRDELYHHMRGPAQNFLVLASAYSAPKERGTGSHEPVLWEVTYGKGRVLICTLGHFWPRQDDWDSLYCVGFQTVVARSCEYLATGNVTLPVPRNFPAPDTVGVAMPHSVQWSPTP